MGLLTTLGLMLRGFFTSYSWGDWFGTMIFFGIVGAIAVSSGHATMQQEGVILASFVIFFLPWRRIFAKGSPEVVTARLKAQHSREQQAMWGGTGAVLFSALVIGYALSILVFADKPPTTFEWVLLGLVSLMPVAAFLNMLSPLPPPTDAKLSDTGPSSPASTENLPWDHFGEKGIPKFFPNGVPEGREED